MILVRWIKQLEKKYFKGKILRKLLNCAIDILLLVWSVKLSREMKKMWKLVLCWREIKRWRIIEC